MQPWVDPTRSALILRRVSTEDQVDNYSWKSQLDLVDLARKDGFVDVQVFDEAGISGEELDNRPVAQRLLEQINSGTAGALYLLNWSRGSRNDPQYVALGVPQGAGGPFRRRQPRLWLSLQVRNARDDPGRTADGRLGDRPRRSAHRQMDP